MSEMRSQSQASSTSSSSRLALRSPLHVAGDMPPRLSPLDAFALQSRLLARQLEDTARSSNRVSRLPPLTPSSPVIVQGRSDYFRSISYDTAVADQHSPQSPTILPPSIESGPGCIVLSPTVALRPELGDDFRPASVHPRLSGNPLNTVPRDAKPPVSESIRHRPVSPPSQFQHLASAWPLADSPRGRPLEISSQAEYATLPHSLPRSLPRSLYNARRDHSPEPLEPSDYQEAVGHQLNSIRPTPQFVRPPHRDPRRIPYRDPLRDPHRDLPALHAIITLPDSPLTGLPQLLPTPQSPSPAQDSHHDVLLPPKPLFIRRLSSTTSSSLAPTDEDSLLTRSVSSLAPPSLSASTSSSFSAQAGQTSGDFLNYINLPKQSSSTDLDLNIHALSRLSFNFSHFLSRSSTPSFGPESPSRQTSAESQPSSASLFPDEEITTVPVSILSDSFAEHSSFDDNRAGTTSYIYSKFSLPRGKSLQRSPTPESPDNLPIFLARTQDPAPSTTSNANIVSRAGPPPSPPTRPSTSSASVRSLLKDIPASRDRVNYGSPLPSPNFSRPSTVDDRSFDDAPRGRPMVSSPLSANPLNLLPIYSNIPAFDSAKDTATALPDAQSLDFHRPQTADKSADEHLAKGIQCHEQNSLLESTYHFRLAARRNHPTAMLLYALACRHGWGMRPNQTEAVQWLRKAVECSSVEIIGDGNLIEEGRFVSVVEQKKHKAQLAISVFELGVSHMNGWGVEQDKGLALRCFEIAGSWGDVDALADAGLCYANGVGCKKDLKQSARFFRMAESRGMNMVGNSWIHKNKYTDSEKSGKPRSKSRTRALFSRKNDPPAS